MIDSSTGLNICPSCEKHTSSLGICEFCIRQAELEEPGARTFAQKFFNIPGQNEPYTL